ncbi:serine hydrolase [Microbacterium sp. G2-8]|uniref:serine hydrolase n=1 Tax=Microbacterium sp. G2-8 TaxID=2842454 RepID=UPI001C8A9305|nr:serine hydrolase [Microbacterium sp. G2-8]
MGTEPSSGAASLRGERRSTTIELRRALRRSPGSPRFTTTMRDLDELAQSGSQVSVHVSDVESGQSLLSGDGHVPMSIAGLGVAPVLVEVAAQLHDGSLDPAQPVRRGDEVGGSGIWRHLDTDELPLADVLRLAAMSADRVAANALLDLVGHESITRRMATFRMRRSAVLDRHRDDRGPDDAPHAAIGTTREYAGLFAQLARREGVPSAVVDHLATLLSRHRDASLVGAPMAVDPHPAPEPPELILLNQVGRADGVRAEAGIVMGRSGALAYALFVTFDDPSLLARHRVHRAFHALGQDLLEIVA